jgi:hypothetical protein
VGIIWTNKELNLVVVMTADYSFIANLTQRDDERKKGL